jgi:hypothetical protein
MELEFNILKMEYVISLTTITHKGHYIQKPYFVSLNEHIYIYIKAKVGVYGELWFCLMNIALPKIKNTYVVSCSFSFFA